MVDLAKNKFKPVHAKVKTGKLRDQLSRYLKRVRQTGDSIMDWNDPVAEIRPYRDPLAPDESADVWTRRVSFERLTSLLDEDFELPVRPRRWRVI